MFLNSPEILLYIVCIAQQNCLLSFPRKMYLCEKKTKAKNDALQFFSAKWGIFGSSHHQYIYLPTVNLWTLDIPLTQMTWRNFVHKNKKKRVKNSSHIVDNFFFVQTHFLSFDIFTMLLCFGEGEKKDRTYTYLFLKHTIYYVGCIKKAHATRPWVNDMAFNRWDGM